MFDLWHKSVPSSAALGRRLRPTPGEMRERAVIDPFLPNMRTDQGSNFPLGVSVVWLSWRQAGDSCRACNEGEIDGSDHHRRQSIE